MFQRFTDRARRVVVLAQEEARMLGHDYIGTEHILLGLVGEGEGVAAKALEGLGIELDTVRQQVEKVIGHGSGAPSGHVRFTPSSKTALELSLRESMQLGHDYIGTEHILLAVVREGDGVAAQVLLKLGADLDRVRHQVVHVLHDQTGQGAPGVSVTGSRPARLARRTAGDVSAARAVELDRRLAALERWVGLVPDLDSVDQEIARLRQDKESAIDHQDFAGAADLRDQEKALLRSRSERESGWKAALADRQSLTRQLEQLAAEVDRLGGLLREHGIEPGDGTA